MASLGNFWVSSSHSSLEEIHHAKNTDFTVFSAILLLSRSASTNSLKSLIDSLRLLKLYVALVKAFHTDLYHLHSLRALSGSQPLPWSCWSGKEYKNRRYYSSSTFLALISNSFFCNNSDRAFTLRETCFIWCRMKFNCCSCGTNLVLDFFRVVVRERFSVPGWRLPRFLSNNSLGTNFSPNLSHNWPTSIDCSYGPFSTTPTSNFYRSL